MEKKQDMIVEEIGIEEIKTGSNIRSELSSASTQSLLESIKNDGLLHPVSIDQDNVLVAGFRRYYCCKKLGHKTIPAVRISVLDRNHRKILQVRENLERQDLSFSEKMKVADDLQPEIEYMAQVRVKEKTGSDLLKYGINTSKGKTRDIMAAILQMGSGSTFERARKVWENADENAIQSLDEGKLTIAGAYRAIEALEKTKAEASQAGTQAVTNVGNDSPQQARSAAYAEEAKETAEKVGRIQIKPPAEEKAEQEEEKKENEENRTLPSTGNHNVYIAEKFLKNLKYIEQKLKEDCFEPEQVRQMVKALKGLLGTIEQYYALEEQEEQSSEPIPTCTL